MEESVVLTLEIREGEDGNWQIDVTTKHGHAVSIASHRLISDKLTLSQTWFLAHHLANRADEWMDDRGKE